MNMMRKFSFLVLLLVATLFLQNAHAALILPYSTYGDLNGWQGSRICNDDGFNVLIDFTVYDTDAYPDEFVGSDGFSNPGEGRYIYAYQIFNHPDAEQDIANFEIFDIDGITIDTIGSQDDGEGGLPQSNEYFDDVQSRVVWEFDWGVLIAGEHSYFLLLSSDYAPVVGDYEISSFQDEGDFPVPEPCVVALLGIGSLVFLKIRRKPV